MRTIRIRRPDGIPGPPALTIMLGEGGVLALTPGSIGPGSLLDGVLFGFNCPAGRGHRVVVGERIRVGQGYPWIFTDPGFDLGFMCWVTGWSGYGALWRLERPRRLKWLPNSRRLWQVCELLSLSRGRVTTVQRAFTLIELLVVVAVISILAAIALPNFLEAQTRAKVSRTMADMRSVATAIEAYRVDQNQYPAENYPSPLVVNSGSGIGLPNRIKLAPLTTPVAYLAALPPDPFASERDPLNMLPPPVYHYAALNDPFNPGTSFFSGANAENRHCQWILQSNGPDLNPDFPNWQFPRYDATNGTLSLGNVLRLGP